MFCKADAPHPLQRQVLGDKSVIYVNDKRFLNLSSSLSAEGVQFVV